MAEVHLYIDDSGSREPDKIPRLKRDDHIDCFALGGVLIDEEHIDKIFQAHQSFCEPRGISYPLHSWAIRGGREDFGWLKKPEAAFQFYSELEEFLLALPIVGIAAVIDRQGYVARYKEHYQERLWLMCKTAYCILVERAAKYAQKRQRNLRVFFEQSGKREDRDIIAYAKALKHEGMPFDGANSSAYGALTAEQFRSIVLGDPLRRTKKTPMIQVADLVLYPMVKGGYDPTYRPYRALLENGKLIDAHLSAEERASLGIKYSCFPKRG